MGLDKFEMTPEQEIISKKINEIYAGKWPEDVYHWKIGPQTLEIVEVSKDGREKVICT